MTDSYVYTPLDESKGAVRLLRLCEGGVSDGICCNVVECSLGDDDRVPYEALSYTWGEECTEDSLPHVLIDGQKKSVTHNLFNALVILRLKHEARYLWIDALCINQADDREKGHQVGQMRDVYEKAESVIIWLGSVLCDTDSLMNAMVLLEEQIRGRARSLPNMRSAWRMVVLQLGETHIAYLRSVLGHLVQHRWFKRVWIIQEVGSARVARILCGTKSISSAIFSAMPFLMELRPDPHSQAVLDIMPGPLRRESWWNDDRRLMTLLGKFNGSEATREHDRVYALLGIATDAPNLSIDYGCPFQEVVGRLVSLWAFGDAYHTHLLHESRPRDEIPAFSLSRLFQGISDPTTFATRVIEVCCEDAQDTFLECIIHESRVFKTAANNAGHENPLSFAVMIYSDWKSSQISGRPCIAVLESALIKQTRRASIPTAKPDGLLSNRHDVLNPGTPQLRLMPLEAFKSADPISKTTAPQRSSQTIEADKRGIFNNFVKALLKGLDVAVHAEFRLRALLYADVDLENLKKYNILRKWVASADRKCRKQMTGLLWRLCREGNEGMLYHLVEGGADVDARDEWGLTPLHAATHFGRQQIVRGLLQAGAKANLCDQDGNTPLHLAEAHDRREIMLLLFGHGADELAVNHEGWTPWQLNRLNQTEQKRRPRKHIQYQLLQTMNLRLEQESERNRCGLFLELVCQFIHFIGWLLKVTWCAISLFRKRKL